MSASVSYFAIPGMLVAAIALTGQAHANVVAYDLGKNYEYQQTGPSTAPVPYLSGAFFAARAFLASSADYNTGTLTYPGPSSPRGLTPGGFSVYSYLSFQTPYITPAAMNAEYTAGTYQFNLRNSVTLATASGRVLLPTPDVVLGPVPTLTASSFNALQSAAAGVGQTISFQGFTPAPSSTGGQTFVTLYDTTANTTGFAAVGIPASTTSVNVPGSDFTAGHNYTLEILYENFLVGRDPLRGLPTTVAAVTRTLAFFTVAAAPVPEPATISLIGLGLLGLAFARRAAPR